MTTEDEVTGNFQAKGKWQKCEHFNHERESGLRGIVCVGSVHMTFKPGTNIVNDVGFEPSQRITVDELIAKFGSPSGVAVVGTGIPETPGSEMLLYYDTIKTRVDLVTQDGTTYTVAPLMNLINIDYSESAAYISDRMLLVNNVWKGYGLYRR